MNKTQYGYGQFETAPAFAEEAPRATNENTGVDFVALNELKKVLTPTQFKKVTSNCQAFLMQINNGAVVLENNLTPNGNIIIKGDPKNVIKFEELAGLVGRTIFIDSLEKRKIYPVVIKGVNREEQCLSYYHFGAEKSYREYFKDIFVTWVPYFNDPHIER